MKKKSVPVGAALIASAIPIAPASAIADRNVIVIPEITVRSRNKLREIKEEFPLLASTLFEPPRLFEACKIKDMPLVCLLFYLLGDRDYRARSAPKWAELTCPG